MLDRRRAWMCWLAGVALLWAAASAQAVLPYGAQTQDQSAFALGDIVWNVIFVESNGSIDANQENWSAGQLALLHSEVDQAAAYWESLSAGFHPNARLNVEVNYVNGGVPLATGYEPINRSSTQESLWINQIMSSLGYGSGAHTTRVRNFNQAMRLTHDTHWSATLFIVNDDVDPNNAFSNGNFAYAYYGGPFTVLTYGNDGWGHNNFNMVLSHEMGHIFMARDEYAGSGQRNTYRHGYLNVLNGNAERDGNGNLVTPPQPNALMLNNGNFNTGVPYAPSTFASAAFGHLDTDGDFIPDILDTFPILTGNTAASNPADGTFAFNGSVVVNPLDNQNPLNVGFSNSQSDMTINTIASAWYALDGGDPVFFDAADGSYGGYIESLDLIIEGLLAGPHQVDVFALNSVDNASNLLSFLFNSSFSPPPVTLLGDANGDGRVDGADYLAVEQYLGATGPADGTLLGDADHDGAVTLLDLRAVEDHFGDILGPGGPGGAEHSPEPTTLALLAAAACLLVVRRKGASL